MAPRSQPREPANDTPAGAVRRREGRESPARVDLEAEYAHAHLRSQRTLIRAACTFAALFSVVRGLGEALNGFWHPLQPVALGGVIALSVVLAAIAWTRAFDRFYLPLANVAVPTRNAIAAAFLVGTAVHGQQDALIFFPLMVVGPFFFMGLNWRVGAFSGVVAVVSFAVAAILFALELPVALRVGSLMSMTLVAGTIAARQLDVVARKSFDESSRISELAQHDALTGLKNRGVFDEALNALWQRAIENRCALAILLIDVDHFKSFNDRYGHQAGDRTLCSVAGSLQQYVERPTDVLTRYGGEEFAAILYDVSAKEAKALAESMRGAAKKLEPANTESKSSAAVTISIGIGYVEPTRGRQPVGALQLADQALYEAKRSGRDRVVFMDQAAHMMLETGIFDATSFAREA